MSSSRVTFALLGLITLHGAAAQAKCDPEQDADCKTAVTGKKIKTDNWGGAKIHHHAWRGGYRYGLQRPTSVSTAAADVRPLQPVRAYLPAKDIPPSDVGAYGVVVLQSKPTPANRDRLLRVCKSFVAHFPQSEKSNVPVNDQMVTIWPLENPGAEQARKDDCDYALDNYDLVAAESAVTDASRQHGNFGGAGPFLVGWSPSKARLIPDSVVLVIDMSSDDTQEEIDHEFLFWKDQIVKDPSKWRSGWDMEKIKIALRTFADTYGPAMMDSVKFFGGR